MSEFFGFYATKNKDSLKVKETLEKLKINAIIHEDDSDWVYIYTDDKKVVKAADVVLSFLDHESSAWDFTVYRDGKEIGSGIFGVNDETGAEDQGFEGDLTATAQALGVDIKKLEKVFIDSSDKFLKLLKLQLLPLSQDEVPPGGGVKLLMELAED